MLLRNRFLRLSAKILCVLHLISQTDKQHYLKMFAFDDYLHERGILHKHLDVGDGDLAVRVARTSVQDAKIRESNLKR